MMNLQRRLYLITVLVLLVGLGSALLIYLTASDGSANAVGYETGGEYVFRVTPEDSKMYRHDMELYGGKANLLADDFRSWFVGLWQGRSLGITVAVCSILIALGLFTVARNLPADSRADNKDTAHP